MHFHINKCSSISFTKSNTFNFQYQINNSLITSSTCIKDLGVFIDKDLKFEEHINHILASSSKTLGFITRSTRDFRNPQSFITLFKTLVLPTLTYSSIVWKPHTVTLSNRLESIQRKFLRSLAFKSGSPMSFFDHNYTSISERFHIPTINSLFDSTDTLLTFKIRNARISCRQLLDLFTFRNFSYSLRCPRILDERSINRHKFNCPVHRLIRSWNSLPASIRSLDSFVQFKNKIKLHCYKHY